MRVAEGKSGKAKEKVIMKLIGGEGHAEETIPQVGCLHGSLSTREDFRIAATDNIIENNLKIFKQR